MEINGSVLPKCLCCLFLRNMRDFFGAWPSWFSVFFLHGISSTWERHGVGGTGPSRAVSGHTGTGSYEKLSPSDLETNLLVKIPEQ